MFSLLVTLHFLLFVIFENLLLPGIFLFLWGLTEVISFKDKCKYATRDFLMVEENTQPPPWVRYKQSVNLDSPNDEWLEGIRKDAKDYYDSSIRDFYSDFSYIMQLGQAIQILISIVNASVYYVIEPQYISLVLLLQAIVSSIASIVFLEIRKRSYPREIENL